MNVITKNTQLDYIDSLRGIAILMVILVHTIQSVQSPNYFIDSFTRFGQMGVVLFFCLSAITQCMSLERTGVNKKEIQNFYVKRYFRIAPLYYTGIVFYFILTMFFNHYNPEKAALHQQYSLLNILANIFFLHGLYPPAGEVVPGGWSIGTEMLFYLLVPGIFLLYKKISSNIFYIILPVLCLAISAVFFYLGEQYFNFEVKNNSFWYYNLINHFPVFITGISYYFLSTRKNFKTSLQYMPIVVSAFVCLLIGNIYLFTKHFSISVTPFLASVAFIVLIIIFKNIKGLNSKVLIKIGQLSYSMYIFHFVFAYQFSRIILGKILPYCSADTALLICYIATIVLSFCVALVSQKLIEQKGIVLGRKFLQ